MSRSKGKRYAPWAGDGGFLNLRACGYSALLDKDNFRIRGDKELMPISVWQVGLFVRHLAIASRVVAMGKLRAWTASWIVTTEAGSSTSRLQAT